MFDALVKELEAEVAKLAGHPSAGHLNFGGILGVLEKLIAAVKPKADPAAKK